MTARQTVEALEAGEARVISLTAHRICLHRCRHMATEWAWVFVVSTARPPLLGLPVLPRHRAPHSHERARAIRAGSLLRFPWTIVARLHHEAHHRSRDERADGAAETVGMAGAEAGMNARGGTAAARCRRARVWGTAACAAAEEEALRRCR